MGFFVAGILEKYLDLVSKRKHLGCSVTQFFHGPFKSSKHPWTITITYHTFNPQKVLQVSHPLSGTNFQDFSRPQKVFFSPGNIMHIKYFFKLLDLSIWLQLNVFQENFIAWVYRFPGIPGPPTIFKDFSVLENSRRKFIQVLSRIPGPIRTLDIMHIMYYFYMKALHPFPHKNKKKKKNPQLKRAELIDLLVVSGFEGTRTNP